MASLISEEWISVARRGLNSVYGFGSNLFLYVLKWIAKLGIFMSGLFDSHNFDVIFSPSS